MSIIDWVVLLGTLVSIVVYGVYKTRHTATLDSYVKGDSDASWWGIGISVMATQASAITFLSTPGQAYTDGMRFIQFYFGLPLAMIVLSVTFIPLFYKLKVYTAYEFLENRFDVKTRTLGAGLFLIQRGLAAGITIYAPSIILSSLLGWSLWVTNILIGVLVIIYTVSGGTKAVTQTQKQQMAVMMGGMIVAGALVISMLPKEIGVVDALHVAGKLGKLNLVNFDFDLNDRYNFWSGISASFFLFMSYFGTDQSQVQRYLSGKSITQSRLGLMMNGLLKIPMQFIILMIGVMVFVFYQFVQPPIFFNRVQLEQAKQSEFGEQITQLEDEYTSVFEKKRAILNDLSIAARHDDTLQQMVLQTQALAWESIEKIKREEVKGLIKQANPEAETNDKDYIFMTYVMDHLPVGLVGLLFAVMFCAAMSSTASELNALGSTTTIDLYKRKFKDKFDDKHYFNSTKLFTLGWGILAIIFATYASLFENLIQAVNLLGSLFYGTILGIFVVAFYVKFIKGNAVFWAAVVAELCVVYIHYANESDTAVSWLRMGFLWYNVVGCLLVVIFGLILQVIIGDNKEDEGE